MTWLLALLLVWSVKADAVRPDAGLCDAYRQGRIQTLVNPRCDGSPLPR